MRDLQCPLKPIRRATMLLTQSIKRLDDEQVLRRAHLRGLFLPQNVQIHGYLGWNFTPFRTKLHSRHSLRNELEMAPWNNNRTCPNALGAFIGTEFQLRDDAEAASAASQGPEEIGFLRRPEDSPGRQDTLGIEQIGWVRGASVLAGDPRESTRE